MIAHGNSEFLRERLFKVSDPFKVSVCKNCGINTATTTECQSCKGDQVVSVNTPYATRLLRDELGGMGLKILVKPK